MIDDWIIARFQSVVNLFQHKPMWWIEQCAYIIGLATIGRFLSREAYEWPVYVFLLIDALCVAIIWRAGRSEMLAQVTFGRHRKEWRLLTAIFVVYVLAQDAFIFSTLGYLKLSSLWSDLWVIALACCYYFGSCENPPPPKPRTKMAFEGGNA